MGTDKRFTAGITWHGAWCRAHVYLAGRQSGRQTYGKNEQGGLIHEFWTKFIQLVFIKRSEPCVNGNRRHWHLLRLQERI